MPLTISLCPHLLDDRYKIHSLSDGMGSNCLNRRDARPLKNSHRAPQPSPSPPLTFAFLGRWTWRLFEDDRWSRAAGLSGGGEEHAGTPGSVPSAPPSDWAAALPGRAPRPQLQGRCSGRRSAPWRRLWCSPQLCPRCSRFVHTLAGRSLDSHSRLLTWFWLVSRVPLPVRPLVFVEAVSLEQRSLLVTPLLKNPPKSLCCLLDTVPIPHPGGTVSTFLGSLLCPPEHSIIQSRLDCVSCCLKKSLFSSLFWGPCLPLCSSDLLPVH